MSVVPFSVVVVVSEEERCVSAGSLLCSAASEASGALDVSETSCSAVAGFEKAGVGSKRSQPKPGK